MWLDGPGENSEREKRGEDFLVVVAVYSGRGTSISLPARSFT